MKFLNLNAEYCPDQLRVVALSISFHLPLVLVHWEIQPKCLKYLTTRPTSARLPGISRCQTSFSPRLLHHNSLGLSNGKDNDHACENSKLGRTPTQDPNSFPLIPPYESHPDLRLGAFQSNFTLIKISPEPFHSSFLSQTAHHFPCMTGPAGHRSARWYQIWIREWRRAYRPISGSHQGLGMSNSGWWACPACHQHQERGRNRFCEWYSWVWLCRPGSIVARLQLATAWNGHQWWRVSPVRQWYLDSVTRLLSSDLHSQSIK